MNSAVCLLYRPCQSVRLRWSNPSLDNTHLFWLATKYDLGHSSISRWHANMRAARRQGVLGAVCCGTRPSSRVRARAPHVQHIFCGGYKRGLYAFQGGQRHHGRFGTPEEEKGGRRVGEAIAGESVLATPLWGMIYADDAGFVSQSSEQLRKMMGVIVIVCAAFGLNISDAKTEIACLRAKGMLESTAIFSVEATNQVYNQTNASAERQPQSRPVHRGRPAHTQRMVQLPEVHPRTARPTERSPRAHNPDAKSRGARDNAVRLRHVEPVRVPLRHAVPSPPQVFGSLHRLARAQSRRPPDFLSGNAYQDGK